MKYETNVYIYDFEQYRTTGSFADKIYTCKFNIDESEIDQNNLLKNLVKFNNRFRPIRRGKDKKEILMKMYILFSKVKN